jgi:hypothetical protein
MLDCVLLRGVASQSWCLPVENRDGWGSLGRCCVMSLEPPSLFLSAGLTFLFPKTVCVTHLDALLL